MTTEQTTTETEQRTEGHDFDAFWASHNQRETVRIFGEDVPLPTDVPLWVVMKADSVPVTNVDEIRTMTDAVWGDGWFDRWLDSNAGAKQLSVVLAYGIAAGQGNRITWQEAFERFEQVMSNPPENRRQRRNKKKGKR